MTPLTTRILATGMFIGVVLAARPATAETFHCVGVLPSGTYQDVVVPQGAACETAPGPIVVHGRVHVLHDASFVSYAPTELVVRKHVRGWPGSTIEIQGQTIEGHVVSQGGSLMLLEDTIGGNVRSHQGTRGVVLASVLTHGSIFLEHVSGPTAEVWAESNLVERGNIVVRHNVMPPTCDFPGAVFPPFCLDVEFNEVPNGSIQVEDNVVPATHEAFVAFNTVGRNLHVSRNTGAGNKVVSDNVVGGNLKCRTNDEPFLGEPNVSDDNGPDPNDPHNQCTVVAAP